VKELIQHECNANAIREELNKIIEGGSSRQEMLSDFTELRTKLGAGGASKNVAQSLLKTIR
jgi:lipid-A-disaccharide synthase